METQMNHDTEMAVGLQHPVDLQEAVEDVSLGRLIGPALGTKKLSPPPICSERALLLCKAGMIQPA